MGGFQPRLRTAIAMRFAYIDSQGNEVAIPSVEALGLRIELGAIGPDTELYDAQAERWGPAHTHEIYHTLSRHSSEEGGFVAPPPPVTPPRSREEPEAPPAEAPPGPATPERPADAAHEEGSGARGKGPPAAAGFGDDLGFELTLSDEISQAPPASSLAPSTRPEADDGGTPPGEEDADAGRAVDLTGLDKLDIDPTALPAEAAPAAEAPESDDAGVMDFSPTSTPADGLDLEPPLSVFAAEGPPAWLEQTGPAEEEDEPGFMRFDVAPDEKDAEAPPPRRPPSPAMVGREVERPAPQERPAPRSRPSPPRRVRRFDPMRVLGALLVIGLVGAGGYFGWTTFVKLRAAGGGAGDTALARPAVIIPHIPESLVPVMRETGERALDGMLTAIGRLPSEMKLPAEPRNDWLAGVYLANASQFPDIEAYWTGIGEFVDRARDEDARVFHDQYEARLADAGIRGDTAVMLLARADSGFAATAADRFEAYAEMDDLVNAALDLHRFLLTHEADIEYAPAAGGVSSDPVLEAVPVTKALGDEMWGMVDRITEALDALGTLDRVTTERLVGALLDRLREAGFK